MPRTVFRIPISVPVSERVSIDAVEAGRSPYGLTVSVQLVVDGTVSDAVEVRPTRVAERQEVVARLAERAGVDPTKCEQALIDLTARLETELHARPAGGDASADLGELEVLDLAPDVLRRPLALIKERGYLATYVHAKVKAQGEGEQGAEPSIEQTTEVLAILRDDGTLFSDARLPNARPLSRLGVECRLTDIPARHRLCSGRAVKRFLDGERADPADVFARLVQVIEHFMDFAESLAPGRVMAEFIACYIIMTYMLDAFPVVGYLWPNGQKGAGKTKLLTVVSRLAYLGTVILSSGSYPTLRDLADCGATLAFDDAETIARRTLDPNKRELLLAGNRRGAIVTLKEPVGKRGWRTRTVQTFCPRLFSGIRLPEAILGSRVIAIPLVKTDDKARADRDPADPSAWPCDPEQLTDDLWVLALEHVASMPAWDTTAATLTTLTGRPVEPWRAVLAVSRFFQEGQGVSGVFDRIEALARNYQEEREDIAGPDPERLVIRALDRLSASGPWPFAFTASQLAEEINREASELGLSTRKEPFTNAKKLGWVLRRIRMPRPDQQAGKEKKKGWRITRDQLARFARRYGVEISGGCTCVPPPADTGTPSSEVASSTVASAVPALSGEVQPRAGEEGEGGS